MEHTKGTIVTIAISLIKLSLCKIIKIKLANFIIFFYEMVQVIIDQWSYVEAIGLSNSDNVGD